MKRSAADSGQAQTVRGKRRGPPFSYLKSAKRRSILRPLLFAWFLPKGAKPPGPAVTPRLTLVRGFLDFVSEMNTFGGERVGFVDERKETEWKMAERIEA